MVHPLKAALFSKKRLLQTLVAAVAIMVPIGGAAAVAFDSASGPPANNPSEPTRSGSMNQKSVFASRTVSNDVSIDSSNVSNMDNATDMNKSVTSETHLTTGNSGSEPIVKINGRKVKLPVNGEVHKTITNSSGSHTSIDVQISGSNQANSNNASINLSVSSKSSDSN